jgi:plastocyanin
MHRRSIFTLAAAAIVVVLAVGNAGQAAPAATTLNGKVGPNFTITLKKAGVRVRSVAKGRFTIVVRDVSRIHNFHLTGPGVNKRTSVGGRGTVTWNVRLSPGTYRFVCDPHPSMRGRFTVA